MIDRVSEGAGDHPEGGRFVPSRLTKPNHALGWHGVRAAVSAITIAMLLALSGGCDGGEEPKEPPDPRAFHGSRAGTTLAEALSAYDLRLPSCALTDARFWDAPKEDDWARNMILRLPVSEDCGSEVFRALAMGDEDLSDATFRPSYWQYAANGQPYDADPNTRVRVRLGTALLPPTERRGFSDMQVEVAVEDGPSMVIHLRATYP